MISRRFELSLVSAIVTVIAAMGLGRLLQPFIGEYAPFLFFLVAPMVAAWLGGLGPGVVATLLSTLASVSIFALSDALSSKTSVVIGIFASQGLIISVILEACHRARKRLEVRCDEIKQSERDYRAIFELAGIGKGQSDPHSRRFVRVNQKLCDITGYSDQELYRMTFSDITHPDDQGGDNDIFDKSVTGEQNVWSSEKRYIRKDGEVIWVLVTGSMIRDPEGRAILSVATVQDINHRKKAEERLKFLLSASTTLASSLDFETTLKQVSILAVPSYADYCVVELVDERGDLQQVSVSHRDPQKVALLKELRERYPPKVYENHASSLLFQNGKPQIYRIITKEDLKKSARDAAHLRIMEALGPCSYLIVPIKHGDRIVGSIGFMYAESGQYYNESDVDFAQEIARRAASAFENAQLYRDLNKAKDDANSANRMKSSFLANMSHEIRTPLNAILGFSNMLRQPSLLPDEKEEYFNVIKRNGELLSQIIDDILDLSKVEAGRLEVVKSKIKVLDIVEELTSVLKQEAIRKGIGFDLKFDGMIPISIESDPVRLRQILFNIIGNAIKFTNQGSVTVRIKYRKNEVPQRGILEFKVIDTGIGLTPTEQERLFRPFTQANESVTRQFGGTGLGLVLSKRLSNALGGDLILEESRFGNGSTFVVSVDANVSLVGGIAGESHVPAGDSPKNSGLKLQQQRSLEGIRVLVVDDVPDNLLLLTRLLRKNGAEVQLANNGRVGVERAQSENFDLILMDIQMPVLDGYQAAKILRDHGLLIPIIAITAHAMQDERERCLTFGFTNYITKPIDLDGLVSLVARSVGV